MLKLKRRPKAAKQKGGLEPLVCPEDGEVKAIFEDTIMKEYSLAGEEQKAQLLSLSPAVKWQMICSSRKEQTPPEALIQRLQKAFHEGEVPDPAAIADLAITIRSGSKTWLKGFFDAGGLEVVIVKLLGDIQVKSYKTPLEVDVQAELLKCLKASMNNSLGIDYLLESPELVGSLTLNLDSLEATICTLVLELLTVVMVHSTAGHQTVLDTMTFFQKEKEETVRFLFLVNSLRSEEMPLTYKRDVILFINTLINSASSLEERLFIRADLLFASILDHIETLKRAPVVAEEGGMSDERYELEVQIEVFEAVMAKDNTEATYANSTGDLNLADAEELCRAVHASAVENGCQQRFVSVMQHFLVIPVIDKQGARLWEAIEQCIHQIVVKVDHGFAPTLSELKGLLEAKEKIEEYAREAAKPRPWSIPASSSTTPSLAPESITPFVVDPRTALLGAIATKAAQDQATITPPPVPPTPTEDKALAAPRNALLAALNKRGAPSPPSSAVDNIPSAAEEKPVDPRSALMSALSTKRGPPSEAGAETPSAPSSPAVSAEEKPVDPKAALMAALNKRAPSSPTTSPSTTEETAAPGGGRAALMKMLQARGGPPAPAAEEKKADDSKPAMDPRACLMANLAKREPPPSDNSDTAHACSSSSSTAPAPSSKPPSGNVAKGLPPGLGEPATPPDPNAPTPPQLPGTASDASASSARASACGPLFIKTRTTPLPLPPGLGEPATLPDSDAPTPPPLPGTAGSAIAGGKAGGLSFPPGGGIGARGGTAPAEAAGVPGKPKKTSVKPPVAMKPLFWTKIPDGKIQNTVWMSLNEEEVQLDLNDLGSMFAKVEKKKAGAAGLDMSASVSQSAAKKEKPKEVHLLDGKVLQNAGIALARYKMTPSDLVKNILAMEDRLFDFDGVKTLLAVAPTTEDISTLQAYDGDVSVLGKVEQFFLEIMKIPNYNQRLECWMYKIKFAQQYKEMKEAMEIVGRAIDQIKGSQKFKKVLEYVLALGNYMNGGTSSGASYGVKLDVLLKLKTIKGVDNKTTLLDFLVKTCEVKTPEVLNFDQDLVDLEPCVRFSFMQWKGDYGALKTGLKQITTQLENIKKAPRLPLDKFSEHFDSFAKTVATNLEDLQKLQESTEQRFGETVTFYGEDATKSTPEEFFGLLLAFTGEFARVKQEVEKRRLMDEKLAKRKQQQAQQTAGGTRAAGGKGGGAGLSPASVNGDGAGGESLVDDILVKIKNKNADEILCTLKQGSKSDTRKLLSIVRKDSDERVNKMATLSSKMTLRAGGAGGVGTLRPRTDSQAAPSERGSASDLHGVGLKSARQAGVVGTLSPKTLRLLRQQKAEMHNGNNAMASAVSITASGKQSPLGSDRPKSGRGGEVSSPVSKAKTSTLSMAAIGEEEGATSPMTSPSATLVASATASSPSPPEVVVAAPTPPPKKLSALERLRAASRKG